MSNILNTIKLVEAKRSPEPDYDDPSWDEKVSNVGQKAKQAQALKAKGKEPRTRWNPETKKYYVDFSDQVDEAEEPSALATTGSPLKFIKQSAGKLKPKYKMELINLLKMSLKPKQTAVAESLGTPYPGTYEQTNDMFKSHGAKRTGTLTTEDEQIDGMAQGEIREVIKNAIHIKNQLDNGVSLDGWMYSYVTTSNDHLNSVAEQINNPNIDEEKVRLDPKCWTGKHKEGTKMKGGVRVNNCVPNESAIFKGIKG
jgi:hypothetical protein